MEKKFTKLELKIIRDGIEKEKEHLASDLYYESDLNSGIADSAQIAQDLETYFTKELERKH